MPISTVDEAEEIAREYVAKKFGPHNLQTITTTYSPSYGVFTVSLGIEPGHSSEVPSSGHEETPHEVDASGHEGTHQSEVRSVHSVHPYDVSVDKNGFVVSCTRIVRTTREAEAIAKEYAVKRHGLTHFLPYATTFDGSYYTVYGGGLVLEEGIVRSALKIYKSKFYDVKVDKSGLVVGWTTEGLIAHYSAKLQKIR